MYGQNATASAGTSVDLSADGNTVAFGAPNTQVGGSTSFTGNVEVYTLQGNTWVQKGSDINGDGSIEKFGTSTSLSEDGNIIAIGQTGDPTNINPVDTGRVKVYQYIGNQWVQLGNTIFGTDGQDEFGYRINLSATGNILAIGTYAKGEVKVFELVNGLWTQIGSTLTGNSQGDQFGYGLSLSSSGSHLAVGARHLTLNNNQPGSAYIFENQGGNWVLIDNPIVGVALADQAGASVAISDDGSKVAVASTGNDIGGNNAGQVRVFENNSVLSVDKVELINEVNAYPNPAADFIKILSKRTVTTYSMFSIDGRLIKQKDGLNQGEFPIDIRDLTSGLYILTIQTQSKKSSFRIVKQ